MKTYKFTENNITYDIEEYPGGSKYWYLNELLHRENGPADECFIGNRRWYKSGKLHRDNGPAIEYFDGNKEWYKNGKLHREDGPAVEWSNVPKQYWHNGKRLEYINSDEELKRYIKLLSIY